MVMNDDLARHQASWNGFTRFVKIASTAVAVIVIGMAIFLL
ncbi:MAG TPA: aa3-type cytochrome c oxidase subunit IV [Stellaceae bacterium]|nr:aa3-type cytochrome c oxidase subunit IV [Stellaceae bacterium]